MVRIGRGFVAAMVIWSACSAGGGGRARFLSIGTGGTGGIYYPLGGAIASRLSAADPVREFTAEVTGGSVENINRIISGEMDLGFTMATNAWLAYRGRDRAAPAETLRLIAPLYPNLVHVVVSTGGGDGVRSVADLRGRRVSVGSAGSGTEQVSRQVLAAYGLSYDDVDERFLSFRESSDALRDGAIDAAIIAAGYPASAVLEVATAGLVRLVPLDGTPRDTLVSRYPYYSTGTIPAGGYPGLERDVPTLAVLNWIVGPADLDSTVVTELLDVLDTERDRLQAVHAIAARIDLDALGRPAPIPVHPAALRWWAGHDPSGN